MSLAASDPKVQVRVSDEMKADYKKLCIDDGTTMQDDLFHFILRRLAEKDMKNDPRTS